MKSLAFLLKIWYSNSGQRRLWLFHGPKSEPPRSCSSWGVLVCFTADWAAWVVLRLCIISIQPLAQVVADYTGHNGNNKGDYIFHENPSFPLERVAALEIIPNFDRKSNTTRLISEGCHKVGVMILQNIPTMAEHFGWIWKLAQLYFLRKKI